VSTRGNTVAIELSWEGTQSGPIATPDGQELPPSNERIKGKSVEVIEVEDGKLKAASRRLSVRRFRKLSRRRRTSSEGAIWTLVPQMKLHVRTSVRSVKSRRTAP
jgi:hypothetical protein